MPSERTIHPKGLRRKQYDGPIEIMSANGYWVRLSTCNSDTVRKVKDIYETWPSKEPFEWGGKRPYLDPADVKELSDFLGETEVSPETPSPEAETLTSEERQRRLELLSKMSEFATRPELEQLKSDVYDSTHQMVDEYKDDVLQLLLAQGKDNAKLVSECAQELAKVKVSAETITYVHTEITVKRPDLDDLDMSKLHHMAFPTLLTLIAAGQHTYIPGVPGGGKSHAAEMAADVLGWRFASISLGPMTPDSRFWGGMNATGFVDTPLYHLMVWAEEHPESGAVFCLDEMDNGNAGNLATLNSAMANGWTTFPNGRTVRFGSNMVFVGAANTYGTGPTAEFAGRNRLDAATLDRFAYLPWETDQGLETALVRQRLFGDQTAEAVAWLDMWRTSRANVEKFGLKIFVTMRGAVNGAKLIAGGLGLEESWDLVLGNKIPSDQRIKVCPF